MNAGTRDGEIKGHFISATVLSTDGNVKVVGKDEMNFLHRHSMLEIPGILFFPSD